MDRTYLRLRPVFHIALWLQVALAHVEPPTNVTLHCHNLHNVLKWNYDQFPPGLRFNVHIGATLEGFPREVWVDPPAQQVDLSFLSDPNNEFFLQVTAVIGEDESESIPYDGITFSYFKDSLVKQKCSVDLPPVNVTIQQDAKVQFRFTHPWLVYNNKFTSASNQKRRKKKSSDPEPDTEDLLPEFEYSVIMDKRHHNFICEESVCEETLPVDDKQGNHCLTITGVLEKMVVKTTQLYCAASFTEPPKPNKMVYIAVSLLVIGVAVFFVLGMVYWKITNPSLPFPPSIKSVGQSVRQTLHPNSNPVMDTISVTEVEPTTPTPLLSGETRKEEEVEYPSTFTPKTCVHQSNEKFTEDEGMCDDIEEGQPDNEGSGYMAGTAIDSDIDDPPNFGEVSSGYERRPAFDNLAPDDRTEGYRG